MSEEWHDLEERRPWGGECICDPRSEECFSFCWCEWKAHGRQRTGNERSGVDVSMVGGGGGIPRVKGEGE